MSLDEKEALEQEPELVDVFATQQESEGQVVHGLLTSAGIESVVASVDATQSIWPGVGGVVVRVNADQAEDATKLIEDYKSATAVSDEKLADEALASGAVSGEEPAA